MRGASSSSGRDWKTSLTLQQEGPLPTHATAFTTCSFLASCVGSCSSSPISINTRPCLACTAHIGQGLTWDPLELGPKWEQSVEPQGPENLLRGARCAWAHRGPSTLTQPGPGVREQVTRTKGSKASTSHCLLTYGFHVTTLSPQDGQSRTIRQFQFTDWPEQGVPKTGEGFIDFIGQVHKTKEQFGQDGPITVHCR